MTIHQLATEYGAWVATAPESAKPTMRQMATEVATRYGLTLEEIRSDSRLREIVWPRQEAMAVIFATGRYSFPAIGRFFGRDHTTVMHGVRKHNERKALRVSA